MTDSLYQKNLEDFRGMLNASPQRAYDIYGVSMMYGLEPEEFVQEKTRLGVKPGTPSDFYNLGVLASRRGELKDAAKYYQQAVELRGDFPELFYNLGLTYERMDQKSKAAEAYQKYVDLCKKSDSEEVKSEVRQIKAHIKFLKG